MKPESPPVALLREIRDLLRERDRQVPGVHEVVAGVERHLDATHSALAENPVLPQERRALLALCIAGVTAPALQPIAVKIRGVCQRLTWRVDAGLFYPQGDNVGEGYLRNNMHCELIGPNGCVFHDDTFSLGLFMLAPQTLYRDHAHVAPELYLNLTGPCGWRLDREDWTDLGPGSLVWNPSGRVHATRTYDQPFLSVYSWTQHVNSLCRVVPMDDWEEIEAQLAD